MPSKLFAMTFLAVSIVLCPVAGYADNAIAEQGEIDGANYLINIPENWNGGLIMYAHGYRLAGMGSPFSEGMARVGNALGYAVAQSAYRRQGWAAEEGVQDTEALRNYFVGKYGKTSPTIIAGHSQGAAITYKTIELYSDAYDGALPMCGTAEPTLMFMKNRIFDMRLLFDYIFPGMPGSAVDFPAGPKTYVATMQKATELVKANPEKAQDFVELVNLSSVEAIPGVIAFWSEILRELQERTGGNGFDNRDTIYEGTDDDATLNRDIPRYEAETKAITYLKEWVTMSGGIDDPVLALHTLVDDIIPPTSAAYYDRLTTLANTTDNFAQLYVDRVGHCNFTEAETIVALQQLTDWIKTGTRPKGGDVTTD